MYGRPIQKLDGGTVAQWFALLPHRLGTWVRFPAWVTVCAESAHSPRVCMGFLRTFSPFLHEFPLGALVSSHSLKDVRVRYIGHAKFSLTVSEQAPECGD